MEVIKTIIANQHNITSNLARAYYCDIMAPLYNTLMPFMKRTTIWIPDDELEYAKDRAKERDESLSSLVRKYFRKLQPKKR